MTSKILLKSYGIRKFLDFFKLDTISIRNQVKFEFRIEVSALIKPEL